MKVPEHIALIPDGNRRWAKNNNLDPWEGHRVGIERFREFLNWSYDLGVKHVTAFSLSKENLDKRKNREVDALFRLYEVYLGVLLDSPDLHKRRIRVYFVGDLGVFPQNILDLISKVEGKSKGYKNGSLTLCMNYSGRGELVNAVRGILREKIEPERVDEAIFQKHLQTKVPEPGLLIRTAERRISNFLLWQLAYTEIYFCPKLFPDFTKDDLTDAIKQYNQTRRKFGE
ncbi:MAG: di-trans,poly-cis-decaprenylcistransferase [Candidatus Altiarchaeota archaeon]|nr:di-trans,poly-cis-decaprenylcistransferase [Candidatus Altiarchaeota archaeon]